MFCARRNKEASTCPWRYKHLAKCGQFFRLMRRKQLELMVSLTEREKESENENDIEHKYGEKT